MRGLMGSLQVFPIPDLVELLSRQRASGALTCERGTIRKTAWLVDGAVVSASSNDPREYFGQFLVNLGHITEEQLARAYHAPAGPSSRLGQALVAQGIVAPEVVRDVLAIKIRETLLDVYLWDAGLFQLETEGRDEAQEPGARVDLSEIAREAELRAATWGAFRASFPTGAATLRVREPEVPRDLGASTVDGRLLALAREGRTIDELALALHLPDFQLYQRLFALARRGILEAAPVADDGDLGAADLAERARALLAEGRVEEAEAAARRGLEVAPGHDGARAALAEAERALLARLEAQLIERPVAPRLALPPGDLATLDARPADKYVLSRCDGTRTARQLAQLLPLPRLEVLRILRRHADGGALELVVPM